MADRCARILRSAQRANRLIQDLLDISAIEAGRFSVDRHPVEMADVILNAIESQQSLASAASIILASDVSPELPQIEADEERLLEVLENLVGNAIKFTPSGGSVRVGVAPDDGRVRVSVSDDGPGIEPELASRLFGKFVTGRRPGRGSGLGLAFCRLAVEAHGGSIHLDPEPGRGATFHFTLPLPGKTTADA